MSCPICDRTMQSIGLDDPARRTFWCSGCGTLKEQNGEFFRIETPANIRHVVEASRIKECSPGGSSSASVEAVFQVRRERGEEPTVELTMEMVAGNGLGRATRTGMGTSNFA